ncbi:MAG TPA: hypothetical protein VLJ19_02690 [Variovorax sp.]|nr:hypothetical protein [Variovorax sp.]
MRLPPMVRLGTVWALMVLVLAGCGGGGGQSGGGPTVSLSGHASYDSVPSGAQGALDYTATRAKPVRGAVVDVVAAGSNVVVGSTRTDEQGNYAVPIPAHATVSVRVRAQLQQSGPGASWDVSVRDNTQDNAIYAMESPTFSTGAGASTRDLHAPSGWGGTRYTAPRVAAPFAVLDTVYQAMAKVLAAAPSAAFPALRVFWSTENVPAAGRVALGQIGTTSYSNDSAGPVIYLLGKENVDTDEYDASVIAHEWGHYYAHAFSRDDSPGGAHGFNELQDMRLAFSEGWGNAWSGMALDRSRYTDSIGPGQGPGTDLDLAAGGGAGAGWYREDSVQAVLWRLYGLNGFAPFHQALSGPLRSTPAVISIHSFAAAYAAVLPAAQSSLASALVAEGISGVTNDPWGANESNAGNLPAVLPLYKAASIGASTPACVSNANGRFNKLGSFVYLRYTVAAARNYQITATGPANADPDFSVFAGGRIASATGPGASETANVSLPAGEVVVVLNDGNDSSSSTCFQLSIQ